MLPGIITCYARRCIFIAFAWISHDRRTAKDYERLPKTAKALIYAAMTRLMARRLIHA